MAASVTATVMDSWPTAPGLAARTGPNSELMHSPRPKPHSHHHLVSSHAFAINVQTGDQKTIASCST